MSGSRLRQAGTFRTLHRRKDVPAPPRLTLPQTHGRQSLPAREGCRTMADKGNPKRRCGQGVAGMIAYAKLNA